MSWNVYVLENSAAVPLEGRANVATVIVKNCDKFYDDATETDEERIERVFWGNGPNDNLVKLDEDDMEHIDYVTCSMDICKAVAAAGTTGRILFGSLEGTNKGQFWGVEFASGHYRNLTGSLQWTPGTSYPGI